MNYLQKSKRKDVRRLGLFGRHGARKKIILALIFVLVLFLAEDQVKGFVQNLNVPINTVANIVKAPFSGATNYFRTKSFLIRENTELQKHNKKLKIELLTIEQLRSENSELKILAKYVEDNDNISSAKVLNRPPQSPFDTLVIDLGENPEAEEIQIEVGDGVSYLDIPIGQIEELYQNSAVVRLHSSSDQKTSVTLGTEYVAEATGIGGGSFSISLPKDIPVSIGDIITSSGRAIGVVEGVELETSNTFQNIYFNFPFSLSEIDWVLISRGS